LDEPVGADIAIESESADVTTQVLSKCVEEENFALMALDGFLLVLNDDGDVTYVSENIGEILGLSKVINIQLRGQDRPNH
jgi:PAS domain-containing protein